MYNNCESISMFQSKLDWFNKLVFNQKGMYTKLHINQVQNTQSILVIAVTDMHSLYYLCTQGYAPNEMQNSQSLFLKWLKTSKWQLQGSNDDIALNKWVCTMCLI